MALPWLVAIAAEYAVFRRFFATDLDAGAAGPPGRRAARGAGVRAGRRSACTLAGFAVASAAGRQPGLGGAGGRGGARRPRPGPAPHHRRGHRGAPPTCRSCCSCWPWGSWSRAVADNGLGGGAAAAAARRHLAARAAGHRRAGRRAGQRDQQPARRAGAAAAGRARRARRRPGRAARGEHRPEPDLRRLAGHPAVAPRRCASTTPAPTSASSPGSGCSPCLPRCVLAVLALWASLHAIGG